MIFKSTYVLWYRYRAKFHTINHRALLFVLPYAASVHDIQHSLYNFIFFFPGHDFETVTLQRIIVLVKAQGKGSVTWLLLQGLSISLHPFRYTLSLLPLYTPSLTLPRDLRVSLENLSSITALFSLPGKGAAKQRPDVLRLPLLHHGITQNCISSRTRWTVAPP